MRANASIAWGYSSSVLFVVHAPAQPEAHDWAEFMEEVRTHSNVRGVVVLASNSRLTPLQRAEIQRWYEENKVRGALVSDSVLVRGIVTAMNWFGVDMRAFAPDTLDEAMVFSRVPASGMEDARVLVQKLRSAVTKKATAAAS